MFVCVGLQLLFYELEGVAVVGWWLVVFWFVVVTVPFFGCLW